MPELKQAVLMAGPTASGKSALALALADRLGGTIVNADSMQVYAGLRVITARPSVEEETRSPHCLYGHVDPAETYSTGQWLREVARVLDDIAAAGRVAIVVGGTGLYFKVLTEGIAAVPAIPAEIRDNVRERLARDGVASLYAELIARDPVTAARLMPLDRSRIARALEVVLATGRSISDWHGEGTAPLLPPERAVKIFVTLERAQLVSRIEARFAAMMQVGALDEVKELAARDLDPLLPAMKAHGVPWLIRHLKGEIPIEEAVAGSIMDTRRYAKRQHTWFRGQMKDWPMVPVEQAFDAVTRALVN
jgi:tRNA dimethylallyltransferase